MSVVVKTVNLGKKFIISHQRPERYVALRDVIVNKLKDITLKTKSLLNGNYLPDGEAEEFWALQNIDLEIKQGDRLGIIGKNGAGKSTLLKILSRITEPTTGWVGIKGRVASLLEVGTGFHPELTGKENIYLNGSILGMTRTEIKQKFDEIVDFSGVEKFLDTPVKRFSSGMRVRLAFSVAAHLQAEILVIDEVLAVGDAEFQKKCLGKMKDVAGEGRTVLFVSHNMAAVQNLCTRAILLQHGRLICDTDPENAINNYKNISMELSQQELISRTDRKGTGKVLFHRVEIFNAVDESITAVTTGQSVNFKFYFINKQNINLNSLRLDVNINNSYGVTLACCSTYLINTDFSNINTDDGTITLLIPKFPFVPGRYSLSIYSTLNDEICDLINDAFYFDVVEGDYYNSGKLPSSKGGEFLFEHSFKL